MFDLFLVRDQQLYELDVRGELVGPAAAEALSEALRHLPGDADVLLDLTGVAALDAETATALRAVILDRRAAGGAVVIVADLLVRRALAAGDAHHVAALAATRPEALRLLPGRVAA
jgi:hypothetical protein